MATKKAPKTPAKKVTPKKAKVEVAPAEKLSQIAAAERVLAENGKPMSCGEMVAEMSARGLWSSPAGKTPAATLYAAILRRIRNEQPGFQKVGPGRFARG